MLSPFAKSYFRTGKNTRALRPTTAKGTPAPWAAVGLVLVLHRKEYPGAAAAPFRAIVAAVGAGQMQTAGNSLSYTWVVVPGQPLADEPPLAGRRQPA